MNPFVRAGCLSAFLVLLPFLLVSLVSSLPSSVERPSDSSISPSSLSRGGVSAFHADEVRQNANYASIPRHHRYAHVRRTWLAARERTARGRRLERLQADAATASGDGEEGSDSMPPMFMVQAQPIKKSIDELQAVVLKQSSQGYKDMLRALMVSWQILCGGNYVSQ